MTDNLLQYHLLVDKALRGVIKEALKEVSEWGLFDNHHFYITFYTDSEKVILPNYLKAQYSSEMTIVLQRQFENLNVDDSGFSVELKFNGKKEHIYIPFDTISAFSDPAVNFSLQFEPAQNNNETIISSDEQSLLGEEEKIFAKKQESAQVIPFEQFRKNSQKE